MASFPKCGLVLSAGGARAAYQAGVLRGLMDIAGSDLAPWPFPIITGVSAGAINASFLAAGKRDFGEQVDQLAAIWSELMPEQVLKTDVLSMGKLGAQWMKDLGLGGMMGGPYSTHLLDSTPLIDLLKKKISFEQVKKNVLQGTLSGVAVSATSYATGTSVTFFHSHRKIREWTRSARIGLKAPLQLEHVLASSSIPFIFKPVKIKQSFYGDGGLRSNAPFSPAIHLGAEKIIAIGVRHAQKEREELERNRKVIMKSIALSDIAGVMFNSLFLDAIEFDYERVQRINQAIDLWHLKHFKKIPALLIQPSIDLGSLAADQFNRFSQVFRYFLKGIGASRERGSDLLSYIAFDKTYTELLVQVGIEDAWNQKDQIRRFFEL